MTSIRRRVEERKRTYHARVELVEVLDAVQVLENLRRNALTEPENRTLAVLHQVGAVGFHPRVARSHERRENELSTLVRETDLVCEKVNG